MNKRRNRFLRELLREGISEKRGILRLIIQNTLIMHKPIKILLNTKEK